MRIIFTGGGTGGHTHPLLAVVEELQKRNIPGLKCMYVGPDTLPRESFQGINLFTRKIASGKLRRYVSVKMLFDILRMGWGIIQSYWVLIWFMPDAIFGKGGYGSFPVVLVGWLFRIPILIHESDAVPGLTNRILGKFAKKIAYSFEFEKDYFPYRKLIYTGHPVREIIQKEGTREEAKNRFQLSGIKKVVLIMGGSQGATGINSAVLDILGALLDSFEVIHLSGSIHFEGVARESRVATKRQKLSAYHLYPSLTQKDLAFAYAASDLIVSRAGAGSIFEIAVRGKASILIPLPHAASDHQKKNASHYLAKGACRVIEEEHLTPHTLLGAIEEILGDEAMLRNMSENAKKFAKPDAAKILADEILGLIKAKPESEYIRYTYEEEKSS